MPKIPDFDRVARFFCLVFAINVSNSSCFCCLLVFINNYLPALFNKNCMPRGRL